MSYAPCRVAFFDTSGSEGLLTPDLFDDAQAAFSAVDREVAKNPKLKPLTDWYLEHWGSMPDGKWRYLLTRIFWDSTKALNASSRLYFMLYPVPDLEYLAYLGAKKNTARKNPALYKLIRCEYGIQTKYVLLEYFNDIDAAMAAAATTVEGHWKPSRLHPGSLYVDGYDPRHGYYITPVDDLEYLAMTKKNPSRRSPNHALTSPLKHGLMPVDEVSGELIDRPNRKVVVAGELVRDKNRNVFVIVGTNEKGQPLYTTQDKFKREVTRLDWARSRTNPLPKPEKQDSRRSWDRERQLFVVMEDGDGQIVSRVSLGYFGRLKAAQYRARVYLRATDDWSNGRYPEREDWVQTPDGHATGRYALPADRRSENNGYYAVHFELLPMSDLEYLVTLTKKKKKSNSASRKP